jgi:hypothetical protein
MHDWRKSVCDLTASDFRTKYAAARRYTYDNTNDENFSQRLSNEV